MTSQDTSGTALEERVTALEQRLSQQDMLIWLFSALLARLSGAGAAGTATDQVLAQLRQPPQ